MVTFCHIVTFWPHFVSRPPNAHTDFAHIFGPICKTIGWTKSITKSSRLEIQLKANPTILFPLRIFWAEALVGSAFKKFNSGISDFKFENEGKGTDLILTWTRDDIEWTTQHYLGGWGIRGVPECLEGIPLPVVTQGFLKTWLFSWKPALWLVHSQDADCPGM